MSGGYKLNNNLLGWKFDIQLFSKDYNMNPEHQDYRSNIRGALETIDSEILKSFENIKLMKPGWHIYKISPGFSTDSDLTIEKIELPHEESLEKHNYTLKEAEKYFKVDGIIY